MNLSHVSLPPELTTKILHARNLPGRPVTERFGVYHTMAQAIDDIVVRHLDRTFLTWIDEDTGAAHVFTYAEFYRQVRRIGAVMTGILGLKRGDRIATAMHNHARTILVMFAAWHEGISVAPLNMGEEDKRLAYVLAHSGARALFLLRDYAERISPLAKSTPNIETLICADGRAEGIRCLDEFPDAQGIPNIAPLVQPDDEALVVYTSGTTGVPKGVVLSQYNLVADAWAIARHFALTPDIRMMCVLPVHHVNGLVVTHVTPFCAGASTVLNRKFSAQKFFQTISGHRVQIVSVVPTLLQFLLEAEKEHRFPSVPTLKHIICGAGPLTVELAAKFEDRFNLPIVHGYGLSETTCYSCFVPTAGVNDPARRSLLRDYGFPSIGLPIETNAMAIQDDNGAEAGENVKGEIVIRGHNVMLGYHDNLKANEGAFTHGWFRSGDEGFQKAGPDGRRYLFISGRFKELIIRGGVKISPLEVDEVLNQIPGIKSAMAVGFENNTYGEEVGAYVVKAPGSAICADDVLSACRSKLPFWMSPKAVVFGDTFPVTSTGKYQRNQLKSLFNEWRETQFRA